MHCLIFDLDGTLLDSEPLCNQAFLDLLPQLEDTVPGLMHRYRGMQLARILEDLSLRIGQPLEEGFEEQYRRRVAELYDTSLGPMPGAVEMLSALDNPRCVASNGPLAKASHGLRAAGLAGFFGDNVYSAYEVGSWKPDPQLFLHAANAMGFPPDRCLVVEDSEAGLQAAKAAGMRSIHFAPVPSPVGASAIARLTDLRHLPELVQGLDGASADMGL